MPRTIGSAEAYVHGVDGPVVTVPARIAALLVNRAGLANYHRQNRGVDPELDNVLVALRVAGQAWRASLTTDSGSGHAATSASATSSESSLSTSQAAQRIGCTARNVRDAIERGRLPAHLVGGRYVLAVTDVEHYRASRAA